MTTTADRNTAQGRGRGARGVLAAAALSLLLPLAARAVAQPLPDTAAGANPAHGEANHVHRSLTPYDAVYKTSTSGLSIKLHRSLSLDDNGVCRLTSDGKLLVAGISEVSVFALKGDRIQPRSYVYQLSGPVSRRREVHFEGDGDYIRSLYKKQWYELPKTEDTLDRMSQQEQLRLSLLNDPNPREDMRFRVADGRKIKEYRLVYQGEDRLETPMGWVDTLHFERYHDDPERRSAVWIAPDWDYLMVRTLHVEDGKTTEANLVSARIDGEPVAGSNS